MEFTTLADKLYITAEALFKDSLELAVQILQSNFRPNFMIGIWRGGTPVGIAVSAMRDRQQVRITTLEDLHREYVDMQTIVFIGSSASSRESTWAHRAQISST